MEPAINPPAEIDDPNDFKPADWDDREKIPDPDATKVGNCVTDDLKSDTKRFCIFGGYTLVVCGGYNETPH